MKNSIFSAVFLTLAVGSFYPVFVLAESFVFAKDPGAAWKMAEISGSSRFVGDRISLEEALLQAKTIAAATGAPFEKLEAHVFANAKFPKIGLLGKKSVSVADLNRFFG